MRWLALNWLLLLALLLLSYTLVFRSSSKTPVQDEGPDNAMAASLKFLTVAARAKHTATVIFVHVSESWLCFTG